MSQKCLLCEEVGKSSGISIDTASYQKKIENITQDSEAIDLSEHTEYYRQCTAVPIEAQKKYFSASAYIAVRHYREQCQVIDSLVHACRVYGQNLFKYFRGLVMDEDSLFHMVAKLALSMSEKGIKNALDDIVERINDMEVFLIEKVGMKIQLDRERMERLYFALLSGESVAEEGMEELDTPGVEVLCNSLEQITDYAPIHVKVKSEFIENVEAFRKLPDKFAKTFDRGRASDTCVAAPGQVCGRGRMPCLHDEEMAEGRLRRGEGDV